MNCFTCGQSCNRGNIECAMCKKHFHLKCAAEIVPNMTTSMVENIKKSNGLLIYRCGQCINIPLGSSRDINQIDAQQFTSKLDSLETKLQEITNILSNNVITQLGSIKADLQSCVSRVEKFEETTNIRVEKLIIENNFLHKQLNRGNVLVRGLPSTLTNDQLYSTIEKMAQVLEVDIQPYDINLCAWTRNKKVVLVKFNSVKKRDELTAKYFENKNLKVNQLVDDYADVEARVFINDHLTPMAANLQYLCHKLKDADKIKKFRIRNMIVPEAKLFFPDGTEKVVKQEELLKMIA